MEPEYAKAIEAVISQFNENRLRFTQEYDDGHKAGELADAAAVFATENSFMQHVWPWPELEPPRKVTDTLGQRYRQLAHAGALILAEMTRIERKQRAWGRER